MVSVELCVYLWQWLPSFYISGQWSANVQIMTNENKNILADKLSQTISFQCILECIYLLNERSKCRSAIINKTQVLTYRCVRVHVLSTTVEHIYRIYVEQDNSQNALLYPNLSPSSARSQTRHRWSCNTNRK